MIKGCQVKSEIKSLSNAMTRTDVVFISIEALVLFFIIEFLGKATGILFIGKGSVVVTLSYLILSILFFNQSVYRSPFVLLSGFEHYSKVVIDQLKIFTILAFEFYLFDLQAGRAFFLFALPVSIVMRLFGRKLLRILYGSAVREMPVYVFSQKGFVGEYLNGFFKNLTVFPESEFVSLEKNIKRFGNSLVLLHNFRDFSREHDKYSAYLVSQGVTLGYLDSYTRVKGRIGLKIVLGALVVVLRQPIRASRVMRAIKRLFDLLVSIVVLTLLMPILPFVYISFAFMNGFPVFFKQKRVGLDRNIFTLYKIRTVAESVQSESDFQVGVNGWVAKPLENSLNPWGKFLRRWSLDELPQIFNVLKGDMSIVGPRPRLESEEKLDGHRLRLSVKPGLTGLWQISGRNAISIEDAEELDDYYIDHWSMLMDIQICAKTIGAIRNGLGAK